MLFACQSYAICMALVRTRVTRMSFLCHSNVLVFYLYVPVCHSYATSMYLHVIRMSLVCTCMSSVCHSYVLVCHPYVTRMSSVCHSYVLACHQYVTLMYSHVICMSLVCRMSSYVLVCRCMSIVCGFTMNQIVMVNQRKQNIKHI